jgi:hypothetical protein
VWWLTPVILVTWEEEIRRIVVQGQQGQNIYETLFQPIKAWCGDTCLSTQLQGKAQIKGLCSGWAQT